MTESERLDSRGYAKLAVCGLNLETQLAQKFFFSEEDPGIASSYSRHNADE